MLQADLRVGANVGAAKQLQSNLGLSFMGMIPLGEGFWIGAEDARRISLGVEEAITPYVKPYRNGKDLLYAPRGILALDFHGMEESKLRSCFPAAYQWLLERVKPARANDKRKSYRVNWWYFAEARPALRAALSHLQRYIGTTETSKHRVFTFLDSTVLPHQKIRAVAIDTGEALAVLSSSTHVAWSNTAGSRLGVGNDPVYNNSRCFDPFPFPATSVEQQAQLRELGERLDTHRKRQQSAHPELTLTGMYNVLEKLRSGEPLSAKERVIHEQGLVSVLRQIHDELDAAVLAAYGWSDLLPILRIAHGNDAPPDGQSRDEAKRTFDEAVLERLVALNAERAAEEARGLVRWLRPEFQAPNQQRTPEQGRLAADADDDAPADTEAAPAPAAKPRPWPRDAVEQVRAVADTLAASPAPLSLDQLAERFTARGPWKRRLPQLLDMLVALGRAQEDGGRYTAR